MRDMVIAAGLAGMLAACAQSDTDEAVKVMSQRGDTIVLRGLVDATRDTPPERFGKVAGDLCAARGKTAQFVEMRQMATFAFDVTYRCA